MKGKWWIVPCFGVLVLLFFLFLPPAKPLTPLGMKVLGIFLFTIIWWISMARGYPSLVALALVVLTGVMTPEETFAASWGNRIVLFLIGAWGLSTSLRVTGFSRRFACWFVARPFIASRPWLLTAMFLLACTLLGSLMSSTAACLVFVAIAEPMLEAMGSKKGATFAAMLMMGLAWMSTASSAMSPIAHSTIILILEWVKRDFAYNIGFLRWVIFGFPMGLLGYLMLLALFRYVIRPDMSEASADAAREFLTGEACPVGPLSLAEKLSLLIFLAVIVCWIVPGFGGGILPQVSAYLGKIGDAVPALIGAALLCVIRVQGQPLLTFREWMRQGVEWDTIALVATVRVLANALSNPETGIGEFLTNVFQPVARAVPLYILLFISILWVLLMCNMMSKIVSITLVYTIMLPIAVAAGIGNPIAFGAVIAAASNFGFSLPSACGSNAIVTAAGWVPVGFMAKYGYLLVIPVALLFTFVGYPLAALVFR